MWPFNFVETITLIGVLTSNIILIIHASKLHGIDERQKEVQAAVNGKYETSRATIKRLEVELELAHRANIAAETTKQLLLGTIEAFKKTGVTSNETPQT